MSAHFNRCKKLGTLVLDSRSGKDVLVLQANVHVSPAHGRGPVRRKLPPRLASCQDQLELSGVQKKNTQTQYFVLQAQAKCKLWCYPTR